MISRLCEPGADKLSNRNHARSPVPYCGSSWYRDGIQFAEEAKKKGSMLYLDAVRIEYTLIIGNTPCTQYLQHVVGDVLDEHGSHPKIFNLSNTSEECMAREKKELAGLCSSSQNSLATAGSEGI